MSTVGFIKSECPHCQHDVEVELEAYVDEIAEWLDMMGFFIIPNARRNYTKIYENIIKNKEI